jgi:hypothetical protein
MLKGRVPSVSSEIVMVREEMMGRGTLAGSWELVPNRDHGLVFCEVLSLDDASEYFLAFARVLQAHCLLPILLHSFPARVNSGGCF